ncbi:MAG: hypothetical protein HC897_11380 [Thermoanaerobaculia bacterium]|nr:hypothetical protein [Thermoanaerobaculia bacterium]
MNAQANEPIAPPATSKSRKTLLWVAAVFLMFAAIVYQRRTGPTYPARGHFEIAGTSHAYKLVRSEYSSTDARVAIPDPGPAVSGELVWKRFKTQDDWHRLPLTREGAELVARLPAQPAAGKLEYFLELSAPSGPLRIPAEGEATEEPTIIIRFKDHVPPLLLWSHVTFMFFSVLIGMRTGLAALFAPATMRFWAWVTLVGLTIGGMVLGPFVQKYAFGHYWTGFPFGGDLTDNKMLIMWVAWILACSVIGLKPKRKSSSAASWCWWRRSR